MISTPTTLVLGAGASRPLHYPLGFGLVQGLTGRHGADYGVPGGPPAEGIEGCRRARPEGLGDEPVDLFRRCRLAVTGKAVTPPLFETMEIVGPERCAERLRAAAEALEAAAGDA